MSYLLVIQDNIMVEAQCMWQCVWILTYWNAGLI